MSTNALHIINCSEKKNKKKCLCYSKGLQSVERKQDLLGFGKKKRRKTKNSLHEFSGISIFFPSLYEHSFHPSNDNINRKKIAKDGIGIKFNLLIATPPHPLTMDVRKKFSQFSFCFSEVLFFVVSDLCACLVFGWNNFLSGFLLH